jgi:ATP-dependent helicase/nuclease subunit B
MLRLVIGRSGFGKSEYLKRLFAEKAQAGEEKLLFIVPDQITFETEAAFLGMLGPAKSRNILVLGFSRMCDYVFELTGHRFAAFADEGVRNMVMSMALEQVSDQLALYGKRGAARDLCEIMLTAVKEYKKCGIRSDDLRRTAENVGDETLSKKLGDTALVYDAYNAIMERSYMDPLDSLTKLAQVLTDTPVFAGYTIAMDAFYGFTQQEYAVIDCLMRQSDELYAALTDDNSDGTDTSLFDTPHRTSSWLKELAKRNGVAIAPPVVLNVPRRFRHDALAAAEENLYRADRCPYDGKSGSVELYTASGIYDECDFVARRIRGLIESGYRYRDIAVIARDTSRYIGVLDTCLEKYNIAYFMDKPQSIDAMPIVRLVGAAFDIATRGFDRDDVLTLLKTGLCPYSVEDIADFENYLYTWDISGSGFYREFTANPSGFTDEFSAEDREQLERVEALRSGVIGELRKFAGAIRDTNGKGIAKALMKLLYALKCDENIDAMCDRLEAAGEEMLSRELVRMWNVLCAILDKTVAVIGDYTVAPKRFAELLYVSFANTEVATIPRGLDEVDIASADRGMLSEKKIVFIIGAIDGDFPRTPVEAGVFTDQERVTLREMRLPLSDAVGELFDTELYYVYSAVTAPSERLYVSCYTMNLQGETLSPSDLFDQLRMALPKLKESDCLTVPTQERLMSQRAAFDWLVQRYRSGAADIAALRGYFAEKEEYAPVIAAIDGAIKYRERRITDPALTRALYGERMGLSATRIDVYHQCPFRYFCEYGLKVKERRRAAVDSLEYGTLIHYIFEDFFRRHGRESYASLDERTVADEVSGILDAYIERHFGGKEGKSERFLYLFYRIKSAATKLVLHLIEELSQSEFSPVDFELGVGEDIPAYRIDLGEGLGLAVYGSVDRVDECEKDGVKYIRVVDYKTGTKKFNLFDILYGINLQMFLYMSAIQSGATQRYGEITPAGVLYMPAVSAAASVGYGADEEEIKKEILKQYTMRGVVLDDIDVLTAMERDRMGKYIPVTFKGDQVKAGADNLATLEQMGAIFRRIDVLLTQMARSLYEGDVGALPLKGKKYDGCAYCKYSAVCLRDEDDPCREGEEMSKDEFYQAITKEADDDEA